MRKGFTLILSVVLGLTSFVGCGKDGNKNSSSSSRVPQPSTQFSELWEAGSSEEVTTYFEDVYTDKVIYNKGDTVGLTVKMKNVENDSFNGTLKCVLSHNGAMVEEKTQPITLGADVITKTESFVLPNDKDFVGYAIETYLLDSNNAVVDLDMTAADCSSDYTRYPRMGYVAGNMSYEGSASRMTVEDLKKYHINALYFQDMMDTHEKPLAGSVGNVDATYNTLGGKEVDSAMLKETLSEAKSYGMTSFAYDLMFGAYDSHVDDLAYQQMGLYKDTSHTEWDKHGGGWTYPWETDALYLMNPANASWQALYSQNMSDFVEEFGFDGMIIDTLGNRNYKLYDYEGNEVVLSSTYRGFLENLSTSANARLGREMPLLFNPVGNYGKEQTQDLDALSFQFMEIWATDYAGLFNTVNNYTTTVGREKGISLAAYMNYDVAKLESNRPEYFNEASVRMTNSIMTALGVSHMELGDNGMLSHEYYPSDNHLKMSDRLTHYTRNTYSFATAYEHLLSGVNLEYSLPKVYVEGKETKTMASVGSIWTFGSYNETSGKNVLNFINLRRSSVLDVVDGSAMTKRPYVGKNLPVKYYTDETVETISFASPDYKNGIMQSITLFTRGQDDNGKYVEFTLPYLEYFTMVVFN